MPRRSRADETGGLYHALNRGNARQTIFRKDTEAVRRLTTESFIRSWENAFWRLGGAPEVVVFDNAKCAVLKADWYDPELHPTIVEFSKHYGFTLLPTRPATPRHKGKVERGVDYAQENALRGRKFESLA